MSRVSGALGVLMVVQTLAWLAGLAIKPPPTSIGIEEGRGGAAPAPRPGPPQK